MRRLLILVAAGSGSRLGRGQPKALVELGGRTILARALESLAGAGFDATVVTAPPDRLAEFSRIAGPGARVVPGGRTRTESVRRGFEELEPGDDDVVAVHDAARPLVTSEEAAAVVSAAERAGAAIAAVAVVDTLKAVAQGRIRATVDREGLFGAATPQAFRGAILRRALASGGDATDDAALCEALGIPVAVVPVSRLSFKITTAADLELAEAILARRQR